MNKFIIPAAIPAAIAATSLAAYALPAQAQDDTVFGFSSYYAQQSIEAQGYDVIDVSEWSNYIVATVRDDAGHQTFKYFNPTDLTLVR